MVNERFDIALYTSTTWAIFRFFFTLSFNTVVGVEAEGSLNSLILDIK